MIEMTEHEFQLRLSQAAEAGADRALAKVGLGDIGAGSDVREIRQLLDSWRLVKTEALKGVTGIFVKFLMAIFFLGVAVTVGFKFGGG